MNVLKKDILQCKVTLQGEDLKNWKIVSQKFQGANIPSVLRMAINAFAKKLAEEEEQRAVLKWNQIGLSQLKKWAKEAGDENYAWDTTNLQPAPPLPKHQ